MKVTYNDYKAGFPGILYAGLGSLEKTKNIIEETKAERVIILVDNVVEKLPIVQELLDNLKDKIVGIINDIPTEPTHESIRRIYDLAKKMNGHIMIAIGGGSIMDMAKVVSVAINNKEYVLNDFKDTSLINTKGIPTVMIPTTAGTGAESTPNAVFLLTEKDLKVGLVSDQFVASYIVLEPRLTEKLPKSLTASTGIDALCHAIESYISTMANPVSRIFSLKAAELIADNIEKAYSDGGDLKARENMLLASFFAGMCLFSSTTVAVHALSYPLGGKYHIPHGISNAILLPFILEVNLSSCQKEYEELAKVMMPKELLAKEDKIPEAFVKYIQQLCKTLQIPEKLTDYGVKISDIDYLTENAMEVKRLLYKNPKNLTKEDIRAIYKKVL